MAPGPAAAESYEAYHVTRRGHVAIVECRRQPCVFRVSPHWLVRYLLASRERRCRRPRRACRPRVAGASRIHSRWKPVDRLRKFSRRERPGYRPVEPPAAAAQRVRTSPCRVVPGWPLDCVRIQRIGAAIRDLPAAVPRGGHPARAGLDRWRPLSQVGAAWQRRVILRGPRRRHDGRRRRTRADIAAWWRHEAARLDAAAAIRIGKTLRPFAAGRKIPDDPGRGDLGRCNAHFRGPELVQCATPANPLTRTACPDRAWVRAQ